MNAVPKTPELTGFFSRTLKCDVVEEVQNFVLLRQSLMRNTLGGAPTATKALTNKSADSHPSSRGGASDAFSRTSR
jgi:hypothetical protein